MKDAYIANNSQNNNFGAAASVDPQLTLGGGEHILQKGLVWLNLIIIPNSSITQIVSANFTVYDNQGGACNMTWDIINETWNEGSGDNEVNDAIINGTTWNNRWFGDDANWTILGGSTVTGINQTEAINFASSDYNQFNTTIWGYFINNTYDNYGLSMRPLDGNCLDFEALRFEEFIERHEDHFIVINHENTFHHSLLLSRPFDRQNDLDSRPIAMFAVDFNPPPMGFDNTITEGKAQARPFSNRFRGEKGFHDPLKVLLGNAHACICYRYNHPGSVLFFGKGRRNGQFFLWIY